MAIECYGSNLLAGYSTELWVNKLLVSIPYEKYNNNYLINYI